MPTENKAVPFEREERYIVLKLKRLPKDEAEYIRDCHPKAMVECVVVERDWPEYHMVWAMIEHRMAGKPVPNFNDWRRAEELQQRLTAADERNDSRDSEIFAQVQSALRRSFSLGQIYWQQADSDSTCQQNKSDQTMEVQEQHILNVLKSLGAALKPAEVSCNIPACDYQIDMDQN